MSLWIVCLLPHDSLIYGLSGSLKGKRGEHKIQEQPTSESHTGKLQSSWKQGGWLGRAEKAHNSSAPIKPFLRHLPSAHDTSMLILW